MKFSFKITSMRRFLIFWAGQSFSGLGSAMTSYVLILWSYERLGTASSIAFLSAFTYLPSILFSFLAGALADRWNKKTMMVLGNSFAACGTLCILILYLTGALQIWQLYVINFLLGCISAFQNSAANVLITMLTPKDHYAQANGMFSLSGSVSTILAPAIATPIYLCSGLVSVLLIDLATFVFAVVTLIWKIRMPNSATLPLQSKKTFWQSCAEGIQYLIRHQTLMRLIVMIAVINLSAYMGCFGLSSAMILSRASGGRLVLGMVSTATGIGALIGSVLVTAAKPAKSRTKIIFGFCVLSCLLYDIPLSLGRSPWIWCAAALIGNLFTPFINANLTATMRIKVPIEMQGRVISAQTTIQCWTIPAGLFLGGFLADHVFEPFMQSATGPAGVLQGVLGTGQGSGIALLILLQGVFSLLLCAREYRNPVYRSIDNDDSLF